MKDDDYWCMMLIIEDDSVKQHSDCYEFSMEIITFLVVQMNIDTTVS